MTRCSELYEHLEQSGITRDRLQAVLDEGGFGRLVHAYETVTVLASVLMLWPEPEDDQPTSEVHL